MPSIPLPSAAEVAGAMAAWQATDARLNTLLGRYPETAPALRHYGLVLWEDGELRRATQALIGSVSLNKADAPSWADLGGVLIAAGQASEATACLEESLALDPKRAAPWLQLAGLRNTLGQTDRAVEAYEASLALDASSADAWLGLGLQHIGAKRYEKAVGALREAVARREHDAAVNACLGEALFAIGAFAEATRSYERAFVLQPDNRVFRVKYIKGRFLADLIGGAFDDALAAVERERLDLDETRKIIHDGFHLLSGFGHREAAIRLGELRLRHAPDDRMQPYLLAALKGESLTRAPNDYVVSYFDQFAEEFDHKLVDVLAYQVPRDLAVMIERQHHAIRRILDLGCGTGLAGACLAQSGRALTGVDLSPRMLDKARERGCYVRLVEAEVAGFTEDEPVAGYELVVAADVLIYFGDLTRLLRAIARVLTVGGLCALSIETTDDADALLLPSGRFAHNASYVTGLAREVGMTRLEMIATTIRIEANKPAFGALLLFERV